MKRPSKKQSFIIAGVVLIAAATTLGIWHYKQGPSVYASAISSDLRRSVDFTLYVPRQMPSGYTLKAEDGVKYAGGILFMQFVKDDQTIFMSQQKKPHPAPALDTLKGFKPIDVAVGKAVAGEQEGNTATVILTDTSLITIASDGTVASNDLNIVAKRLEKVE